MLSELNFVIYNATSVAQETGMLKSAVLKKGRRWEGTKKSKKSFEAWGWRDGAILWSRGRLSPDNSYTA